MKYSDDNYKPFDYRDRVILSEKDLKGLLWLTKMNIILWKREGNYYVYL